MVSLPHPPTEWFWAIFAGDKKPMLYSRKEVQDRVNRDHIDVTKMLICPAEVCPDCGEIHPPPKPYPPPYTG